MTIQALLFRMSFASTIPVEIWHEILQAVIHVPFVLDTTVPTEGCFWHQQNVYHEKRPYKASEGQRKLLRLVCKSWQLFADSYQFRWITFNSGHTADAQEQKEARMALWLRDPDDPESSFSRPRRALLHVTGNEDLAVFRKCINDFSSQLTTLFVDCSDKYGTPIFDHLIAQSSILPCLRCLMLKALDFRSNPLERISSAFPKLTGLTLERGQFPHNSNDYISLPQLESLYFDFKILNGMRPEAWYMPDLVRLSVPLSDTNDEMDVVLRFLRNHGKKLVFLHLNAYVKASLTNKVWSWCPSLTEIATSFSKVLLQGPIPPNHPITYLVHFVEVTFVLNWSDNGTYMDGTSDQHTPVVLRNIHLLPPNFSTFVVAVTSWSYDPDRRVPTGLAELLWNTVYLACQERGIRLEDENRRTFDECFAVHSSPRRVTRPRSSSGL